MAIAKQDTQSPFELKDAKAATAYLHFGPKVPAGKEKQWIKTTPSKGWFTDFRIYRPSAYSPERPSGAAFCHCRR